MSMMRRWQVSLCVLTLSVAAPFHVSQAAEATPPASGAKAPPRAATAAPAAAAKDTAAPKAGSAPATGRKATVVLTALSRSTSAADLIREAQDFRFYGDVDGEQACLEAAVQASSGSRDSGKALALLADSRARADDTASADALYAQLQDQYVDGEVLAFAELVKGVSRARKSQDFAGAAQLLSAAANEKRGTEAGAWAALRLGDLYVHDQSDFAHGETIYRQVITDYPSSPPAQEALVALAEALNWSDDPTQPEALETFRRALSGPLNPGLTVRALTGLGLCHQYLRDWTASYRVLSQVIDAYPDHIGISLSHVIRSGTADRLGLREVAAEDAAFFLSLSDRLTNWPPWRALAYTMLGKSALQRVLIDEAEGYYTKAVEISRDPRAAEYLGESLAAVAVCRDRRGDLAGALQLQLEAADSDFFPANKPMHLNEALLVAQKLGDKAAAEQIIARMVAEFPGSHLTAQLVGHEILPTPEF